jgi:HIV-1 Vpr-binding protein
MVTLFYCRVLNKKKIGNLKNFVLQQDMDSHIHRLFNWAMKSAEPLQSYATGMLAAAMEVQDIAANFRYFQASNVLHYSIEATDIVLNAQCIGNCFTV